MCFSVPRFEVHFYQIETHDNMVGYVYNIYDNLMSETLQLDIPVEHANYGNLTMVADQLNQEYDQYRKDIIDFLCVI